MAMPDGYDAYVLWLAVKQHFTRPSYDFIKYCGKVNAPRKTFEKRRDRAFFYRLSTMYKKELKDFYISVYCKDGNEDTWAGEFVDEKFSAEFIQWKKRKEALTRTFKQDIKVISEYMEEANVSFKDVLTSDGGNLPAIVQLEREHICPETLVLINRMTNFLDKYCVHPLWEDVKLRLTKYERFVRVDTLGDFANILKDGVTQ